MHHTKYIIILLTSIWLIASTASSDKLQIGKKKKIAECTRRSRKGDELWVNYKGTVKSTGEMFDSNSLMLKDPYIFTLGVGQVIKGTNYFDRVYLPEEYCVRGLIFWVQSLRGLKVFG